MMTAVSIFGLIMGVLNIYAHRKSFGIWFWIGILLVVISALGLYNVVTASGDAAASAYHDTAPQKPMSAKA